MTESGDKLSKTDKRGKKRKLRLNLLVDWTFIAFMLKTLLHLFAKKVGMGWGQKDNTSGSLVRSCCLHVVNLIGFIFLENQV